MILKQEDYDYICESCDSLLNKSKNQYRIANDWLHVIRPHPIYFKQYEHIFKIKHRVNFYLFLIKKLLSYTISLFLRLFISLKKSKPKSLSGVNQKMNSIFISHLLNKDQAKDINDFYFNEIPNQFCGKNNSLLLLINHTKENYKFGKEENKIVIPHTLSFLEEIRISFKLFLEAIKICNTKVDFKIKLTAAVESLSPSTHINLRIGLFTKELIKIFNPNYIFTTYEGQAWERLVYGLSKKENNNITNVGYQHALFFRNQHSIARRIEKNYNPDFVLCSGENSKKKFIQKDFLSNDKIILLGSNRISAKRISKSRQINTDTFLVLPEGDLAECLPIVDFSLLLANTFKNLKFIVRLHPITNRRKLLQLRPLLRSENNIELSNETFDFDINRSNFSIYRGSTAIIKAIQSGLYPLYYHIKDGVNVDPLYNLNEFKSSITTIIDFQDKIKDKVLLESNQHKLFEEINSYFSPFDYNQLKRIKN